jgi:DNA polymerase (family 10)
LENKEIIRSLRKTVAFMEITGANAFKVRAVSNAIFTLERIEQKIASLSLDELIEIDGVGKSLARQIHQIAQTGTSEELDKLSAEVPPGVQEMQGIGGLGAKKIRQLWQEYEIDSIRGLKEFIDTGKLADVKGFGEKTIRQISDALEFRASNARKMLLSDGLDAAKTIESAIGNIGLARTGQLARQEPVIEELSFLIKDTPGIEEEVKKIPGFHLDLVSSSPFNLRGTLEPKKIPVKFRLATENNWGNQLIWQTGPMRFLQSEALQAVLKSQNFPTEEEIFKQAEIEVNPPDVRGFDTKESKLIETKDITGILHAHSTYSDGQQTLTEMIEACISEGYEYFGITDHSRSSYFYANGLFENRVMDQFREIDALREKYPDFTIFKGIECDILTDGKLDYADDILSQFDFIIASVHSVLNMDIETATKRLVRAIENPYTTMLGHLTGRLLLRRQGYPLHMPTIIDACAANDVSIELNANPNRLDVDFTWIPSILEKGIKISINPDAHSIRGLEDVNYGVKMARKAGVTPEDNLTSYTAEKLKEFFAKRRTSRAQ